jgi:hypothetical protein
MVHVDNLIRIYIVFIPDVRLMTVYEIGTGQAYRYGDMDYQCRW